MKRRVAALAAALAVLLSGCGNVAGTPSAGKPAISKSTATTTTRTTITTPPSTTTTATTPALQVAPGDFTAYTSSDFSARWNDTTQDPSYESTCNSLADEYPSCWSVQVWNGNVICPTGVTVNVDLYDGTVETTGALVGQDFGISLDQNIQPYSSTVVHIFTDKTFPSGNAVASITSVQCAL